MSKIGYIRVSTEHQETARQQEIMCDYQVERIFSEKISGAKKDRPQLKAMLDYVREGNTLYVESISSLLIRWLHNFVFIQNPASNSAEPTNA